MTIAWLVRNVHLRKAPRRGPGIWTDWRKRATYLTQSRSIWSNLRQSGPIWTNLGQSKPIRSKQGSFGSQKQWGWSKQHTTTQQHMSVIVKSQGTCSTKFQHHEVFFGKQINLTIVDERSARDIVGNDDNSLNHTFCVHRPGGTRLRGAYVRRVPEASWQAVDLLMCSTTFEGNCKFSSGFWEN